MTDSERPVLDRRSSYEPLWRQEEFIVPLLRQQIAEAFARYATTVRSHPQALDIGCGRQPFRQTLEGMGYAYTGLDVTQNPEGSVDIVCAIDGPLPAELTSRGPFDFVLCTEVLEHVADWNTAFQNLAQLLKTGGRLLVTCPHFYQLHEAPYDFWRPTPYALQHYGRQVGLHILRQRAAGNAWDVLGTLLPSFQAVPASARLRDRAATTMVKLLQRGLFWVLRTRRLQRMVRIQGSIYLSNIVVFERR